MPYPWNCVELQEWSIVGMNHYRLHGKRHLFVAMTRGTHCIHSEGCDESLVFAELVEQAKRLNEVWLAASKKDG